MGTGFRFILLDHRCRGKQRCQTLVKIKEQSRPAPPSAHPWVTFLFCEIGSHRPLVWPSQAHGASPDNQAPKHEKSLERSKKPVEVGKIVVNVQENPRTIEMQLVWSNLLYVCTLKVRAILRVYGRSGIEFNAAILNHN